MPGRLMRWIAAAEPDWDAVYAEQLPRVYNFFRYRCGPGADVEELTARTFEKAWRARHRYRRDLAAFATWLLSIARNVAIDDFRASRAYLPLEVAVGVEAGGRSPEDAAVFQSDAARLAALLERLPERDRELLSLKYGAGMTNRDIAAATGLSESNVGTILPVPFRHCGGSGQETEMNETVLFSLREEPSPEFAARLRGTLRDLDSHEARVSRREWPVLRIAASVVVVGVAAALLAVPSVRAAAASLLARFRIVHFVAVEIDESRVKQLRSSEIDLPGLIGGNVQVLQDPGPPVAAASPEEAGAATGVRVRVPGWIPPEVTLRATTYRGPGRVQVVAETARLEQLLDFLGIDDVQVPPALDGKTATIDVPAIVKLRYANDRGAEAEFLQARSPEVLLPEGVEVDALAEIGLRILGFGAEEAKRFAQIIDWRSTMLVPIPSGHARFKRVDINGNPGLLIARTVPATGNASPAPPASEVQMLIWSANGMVFGIRGNFREESVLQMAYSAQ